MKKRGGEEDEEMEGMKASAILLSSGSLFSSSSFNDF